ncbi:MAG: HEAT repeat domain-containing protein [Planctomycetes bacterium]|nr:HEAT repeat domain-containing protein [Planctomycetota bacterium]
MIIRPIPTIFLGTLALCLAPAAARADVVHTAGGRAVAGTIETSSPADPVIVTTLQGRVEIPREDVLLVEDRAELLRALCAAKRRLAPGDLDATIQLADWALRKGLFAGALELADGALDAAQRAESTSALKLPPALFEVPVAGVAAFGVVDEQGARALLGECGGRKPATALVAAHRLKTLAARSDVTAALLSGLEDQRPKVRRTALEVLALTIPEGTIERVIERMLFDRDARVRAAATETVRAYGNDGVIHPLVRALRQDDQSLRGAAMDAIEMLRDKRAVATLIRSLRAGSAGSGKVRNHIAATTQTSYVRDYDVEIAQAAVIADPVIDTVQHGVVLDVGAAGVSERRMPAGERARVLALLEYLTGQKFGDDVARWEAWLEEQR